MKTEALHNKKVRTGSSDQSKVRAFFKKGLKATGRGIMYLGTVAFLTWVALTSTASTVNAQSKEITQKIESVTEKKGEIKTTGIERAEVRGNYLYFWTAIDSFKTFSGPTLDEIKVKEGIVKIETFNNGAVVFTKYGIYDIEFKGEDGHERCIGSNLPLTAYYYDSTNRTSIGANEDVLEIIHPLGRITLTFEQVGKMLKREIVTSPNVTIEPDPTNANWTRILFDGKATLNILGEIRDPKEAFVEYIPDKMGSGN